MTHEAVSDDLLMPGLAAHDVEVEGVSKATPAIFQRSSAPRQARGRRIYAAIDLGTNNCRMLLARPASSGFVIVDAFSRVVRLGEAMMMSGRIAEGAQDRAIDALAACAEKLNRRNISVVRSVATEACRRAANGSEFVDRVYRETGIALDVISPAEEARLAVMGCQSLLDLGEGVALVFDIGGGSTELVLVSADAAGRPQILQWASVPWGVVSLAETEPADGSDIAARRHNYTRMYERVADAIRTAAAPMVENAGTVRQLLGTSGTVTTLASLYLQLPHYDRRKVDGCIVPADAMRAISEDLALKSIAERRELACIGTERADLVVAGCAILEAILDMWPADRLRVADRGIREGILRELMGRDGHLIQ